MNPFKRIKISHTGEQMPDDATGNAAVFYPELGLMVANLSVGVDGQRAPHGDIAQACETLSHAGFNDWVLGDDFQSQLPMDRSKDPCIDTEYFSEIQAEWHWTSQPCLWSSGVAFRVGFGYGAVGDGFARYYHGFGVAVRRAKEGDIR